MATTSNNFILNEKIKIPIIQRDYVLGSDKWETKRDAFIKVLFSALYNNEVHLIDFIYGTQEKDGEIDFFIPLDGQQRLTTLSLMGWLLVNYLKECDSDDLDKNEISKEDIEKWRSKIGLNYKTRSSSKYFCKNLFPYELKKIEEKPSKEIKNQLWYAEQWEFDPTIKAMLQMLDAMWKYINDNTSLKLDIPVMTKRFFTDSPIRFEIEKLKNQKRSDDLYIKVNARGKHLTDFEHWKVKFIQLLKNNFGDKVYKDGISYKNYFEQKIEKEWCDIFWFYAKQNWNETDKKYPRIDEFFMRFFHSITEILYALIEGKSYIWKDPDKAAIIYTKIYSYRRCVNTLFELLDSLVRIVSIGKSKQSDYEQSLDPISLFFNELLFSISDVKDDRLLKDTRVNIFNENNGETNLFASLIVGKEFGLRPRLLFFGLLKYIAVYQDSQSIQEFIRTWWGYLLNGSNRQRNADKYFDVATNIRLNPPKDILRIYFDFLKLIENEDPEMSISFNMVERIRNRSYYPNRNYYSEIVPLMNCCWLLFDLHNLDVLINNDKVLNPADTFYKGFVHINNRERIKGLILHGFDGCKIGDSAYTFGLSGNWDYILTNNHDPKLQKALNGFLSKEDDEKSKEDDEKSTFWLAQFIYRNMDSLMEKSHDFSAFLTDSKNIVFSKPNGKKFQKRGYRLDPFAWVIAKTIGAEIDQNPHLAYYLNNNGKRLFLKLHTTDATYYNLRFYDYGLNISSKKDGWKIEMFTDEPEIRLPQQFIDRFGDPLKGFKDSKRELNISNDGFISDIPEKNHEEIAEIIIKEIADTLN